MKWSLLLGGVSCVLLMVGLEWWRRHREYWNGLYLRQQVIEWYERDAYGDEPTIHPANLPPVKKLEAKPVEPVNSVQRFRRRLRA